MAVAFFDSIIHSVIYLFIYFFFSNIVLVPMPSLSSGTRTTYSYITPTVLGPLAPKSG